MPSQRLMLALGSGALNWPEGRILALRPQAGMDGFPLDRTQIVHGFRPDFVAWERAGVETLPTGEGDFSAVFVAAQRSKEHSRILLQAALHRLRPGGLLVVDGQKTEGIDGLVKAARAFVEDGESFAKAHGKLFWGQVGGFDPAVVANLAASPRSPDGWHTASAGFSPGAVDEGSALLIEHLPAWLRGEVLDLGAGWGYLAKGALGHSDVAGIDLVEAEYEALAAARRNISDPRARFLWDDAATFAPGKRYDAVICNPPFHTSRKSDPSIGQMFLRTAARLLKPSGGLALVANRHLPYEQTLNDCFAESRIVTEAKGYKIVHARKPRQSGAARAS